MHTNTARNPLLSSLAATLAERDQQIARLRAELQKTLASRERIAALYSEAMMNCATIAEQLN